jgi:hypothetical protein
LDHYAAREKKINVRTSILGKTNNLIGNNNNDNNNSIKFVYLRDNSTAQGPITK